MSKPAAFVLCLAALSFAVSTPLGLALSALAFCLLVGGLAWWVVAGAFATGR